MLQNEYKKVQIVSKNMLCIYFDISYLNELVPLAFPVITILFKVIMGFAHITLMPIN